MSEMRISDEKRDETIHDVKAVVATKTAIGDEAFQQAMIKEPPPKIGVPRLIIACAIAFCCSTANGYDGSLFSTLLSNPDFKAFFDIENVGIGVGVVTAMYQIGSVIALPFVGPAIDTWGRRVGMFIGGIVILLGVVIQIATINNANVEQFMAGRFFMGFGVSIIGAAGPVYVVEVCHPAQRGFITGLYNVMWPVGALVASGAARGGLEYEGSDTSWIIPVGLQGMFPFIVCAGAFFLPESPRWLFTRSRRDEATATLVSLHGRGNLDSAWVQLQLREYEELLEMDGADKVWWDYRALFRNRASIYRLMCNCLVSLFGQWAGNGIVSYYLSAFLDTAGIRGSIKQTNVAMGMNSLQIVFAGVGASIVDIVGRRPMLVTVNIVCGLCWIGIIIPASIANVKSQAAEDLTDVNPSVSQAMLAMVYIFQICYSVGWTPLQALYPVEVLSYEMRAKGMAFSSLFTSIALLANQFGVPEALLVIKWRTYIVFCVWCFIQSGILFFLVPETKNRTLEELDHIFAAPSPVKASREKKHYEVDASNNVIHVDPVTHVSNA